jgi:hypothetical protein
MVACCLVPLAGRSSPPAMPAATLSPYPHSRTAHGLSTSAAGQDEDRARPPPARPGPRPPARLPPKGLDRPHRQGPSSAKTAPARRCALELAGAARACPSVVLGAHWSPHRISRAMPELAASRAHPWPEQLATSSPGRSSPCLPLYRAPRSCPCPKLTGAAPATGRSSSCLPLARARRRRRSRRGAWRSDGEARGHGEGGASDNARRWSARLQRSSAARSGQLEEGDEWGIFLFFLMF